MTKYKCGHESKAIFLNNDALSIAAYETWRETTGYDGNKSECFDCFCKRADR